MLFFNLANAKGHAQALYQEFRVFLTKINVIQLPMSQETLNELIEDFALFDDWEERYRYLIDLGRALPAMDEALKTMNRWCAAALHASGLYRKFGMGSFISRLTATPISFAD